MELAPAPVLHSIMSHNATCFISFLCVCVLVLKAQAEEVKAAVRANGNIRSRAVSSILKAARKDGELSRAGILGRLGDLATIDQKYDVAVSTACGMLDHIVVHTTAGAQRCLAFLRKYNLGRANFVPLDKMKKGAHDRVVETPEGAPRLFELITPSNYAITPALYLGVGNTLVAPDLETATRWGYDFGKRWRVVTLDGQLIETSGTMSGGGKSSRKGGMRLNVRTVLGVETTCSSLFLFLSLCAFVYVCAAYCATHRTEATAFLTTVLILPCRSKLHLFVKTERPRCFDKRFADGCIARPCR